MRTLHQLAEFVGIPRDKDDLFPNDEIRLRRVGYYLSGKGRLSWPTSLQEMNALADALPETPITLDASARVQGDHVHMTVPPSRGGFVLATTVFPTLHAGVGGPAPRAFPMSELQKEYDLGKFPISSWKLTAQRTGLSKHGYSLVEKTLYVDVKPAPKVEPIPQVSVPPVIDVSQSGPPEMTVFHVRGSGFLLNQPDNQYGISIRAVNGVNLQDYIYVFTGSDGDGRISRVLSALDTRQLARNSVGEAILHFSATDSRKTANGQPLWSNTVTFRY